MVSIGTSFTVSGIEALPVTVEVDIKRGLPSFYTVGLPDQAVSESKSRVIAAIKNSGYLFPAKKITVNLAPADIRKEGSLFDCSIALGILEETNIIKPGRLDRIACVGELSLSGDLRRVCGAMAIALSMKKHGIKKILLPYENAKEAALIDNIDIIGITNLKEAVDYINGDIELEPAAYSDEEDVLSAYAGYSVDFSEVKGHDFARRACEIAAAGNHNMILVGPPGAGKTMLAKRMVTILPPLNKEEVIEVATIRSVAGEADISFGISRCRPFRSPHSTSSDIAIIGGGSNPKPGEVTLAHRGILFLDEFPEFSRKVIESLRQPLSDGEVTISRASETVKYPADFMFIASMNPCPCGYRGSDSKDCVCSEQQYRKYRGRISGPIIDRIDICLNIPVMSRREIASSRKGESSESIRKRVVSSRQLQELRFKDEKKIMCNAAMTPGNLKDYCRLEKESNRILYDAIDSYNMSARVYDKIIKLARTIADLDASDKIEGKHISEALQYRFND